MAWFWISTRRVTVAVETDAEGKLKTVPPYLRKFRGQPVGNAVRWLDRLHGGLVLSDLSDPRATSDASGIISP